MPLDAGRSTKTPRPSTLDSIPGLGQLIQGRVLKAAFQFVLAGILWWFLLGWIVHLWSIIDAALWKPREAQV